MGPYADYVLGAPKLAAAFERGTTALPFILSRSRVFLREEGDHVVLQLSTGIQSVIGGRQIDEGMVFVLADLARHFAGSGWNPDWVELPRHTSGASSALEELFDAPIVFCKDLPGIAVPKILLLTPNPFPGSKAGRPVYDDIRLLSGFSPPATFTDLVLDTMTAHLIGGEFTAEAIAERIGLGVRTLQRRLRSEGNSYRDIRMHVIDRRARALLAETEMSVTEVAAALGFDEVNSFRRAFHGWTGLTPTEFVQNLKAKDVKLDMALPEAKEAKVSCEGVRLARVPLSVRPVDAVQ